MGSKQPEMVPSPAMPLFIYFGLKLKISLKLTIFPVLEVFTNRE
jgi:hypothetical protein